MSASRPDMIITDIMMPEMDGMEVLKAARALYPKMPVIAISGGIRNSPANFLQHAQNFEAGRVLEKPVPLGKLLESVKELLGATPAATA